MGFFVCIVVLFCGMCFFGGFGELGFGIGFCEVVGCWCGGYFCWCLFVVWFAIVFLVYLFVVDVWWGVYFGFLCVFFGC